MTKIDNFGLADMARLRGEAETAQYPETVPALIDAAAEEHENAILAKWLTSGETITYADYAEKTRKLANAFEGIGIRKGTHVGVMLPNVSAFVITWGALARIGAVMVPVNFSYTERELLFVLTDSDAQFLIADESVLPVWKSLTEQPPLVNDSRVVVHGERVEGHPCWAELLASGAAQYSPSSPLSRTDLLNLQYTSGTTGFPKGCMLSHDYWVILGSLAAKFRGTNGEVKNVLIHAPFFYMDPMWQFLMTLVLGGTAKIAPRISMSNFYKYLTEEEIHYCIFPEPGLRAWDEGEMDSKVKLKFVSIFGWRAEAREEIERRFGCVARESFGMTEIGGGHPRATFGWGKGVSTHMRGCRSVSRTTHRR